MARNLDPSELGRYLASLRQPRERVCELCGQRFMRIGKGKYCSDKHAKLDWWRKHRSKKSVPPGAAESTERED